VITLLTDFGTVDYFVGAVKGAILSINPRVVIVDITHEIPPQDVEGAAFTLLASYQTFPNGTIHVAVVDPGVGSARRAIVVRAGEQFFVGPDNGIFTYIYDREPSYEVFHAVADEYFRPSLSSTFHGRDIFAPVAAALSNGVQPEELGPWISDEVRLTNSLTPEVLKIIHIDRFGNCVTNITRDLIDQERTPFLVINRKHVRSFREFYSSAAPNELFAIWGSAGFLEISMNGSSAAKVLGAKRGDPVTLRQD
jgi:S-adenosyl-L-methionine hydrolase (adenosine-forming)